MIACVSCLIQGTSLSLDVQQIEVLQELSDIEGHNARTHAYTHTNTAVYTYNFDFR